MLMRRTMFTFGTDEKEAPNQEAPAKATFLRSDGEWMDYAGTSGPEWCTRAKKIERAAASSPKRQKIEPPAKAERVQLSASYVKREPTARPPALHPFTPQLRILSWNINGIRAQLAKEEGRKALQQLVETEKPHVLGLQEIRIKAVANGTPTRDGRIKASSDTHFVDVIQSLLPDYHTFWLSSFPPARQGYSGTALLVRRRRDCDIDCPRPLHVRGGIGCTVPTDGDLEGRVMTVEYDVGFVVNVYTPNSGAGLKRLDFRTSEWDQAFAAYVRELENTKPVVVIGDMNVAHEDKDFYNPEDRRMRKAAGTTPEERRSFAQNLLGRDPPPSCGMRTETDYPEQGRNGNAGGPSLVDTFRAMHPDARGVFSYWSTRAKNRPVNRGMRLDYCLASRSLVDGSHGSLHDAFVLDTETVHVSDHCPVGVVLRIGENFPE